MSKQSGKEEENNPFKVFFTTSNQSSKDKEIEYYLDKGANCNFKKVMEKTQKYKMENFTVSVYCFDIIKNNLKEKDKDSNTKKYKVTIKLKQKGKVYDTKYDGIIYFKDEKSNFIYDFEFQKSSTFYGLYDPPNHIKFSKLEQLKIYEKVLKLLNVKQGKPLSLSLISDSQLFLRGEKSSYDLDFFLEILKSC